MPHTVSVGAVHQPAFGQRINCVQRKSAIGLPSACRVTVASHTWVFRPRCAGFAMHAIVPSRAVPINAETGLRDDAGTITEYFFAEFPPRRRDDSLVPGKSGKDIRDQLF